MEQAGLHHGEGKCLRLRYRPGTSERGNNLEGWLVEIEGKIRREFGDLAFFFQDDAYYEEPMPIRPTRSTAAAVPDRARRGAARAAAEEKSDAEAREDEDVLSEASILKSLYLEEAKQVIQANRRMKNDRAKAFEIIWQSMSLESQRVVEDCSTYDHKKKDPLELIRAIKKTHRGVASRDPIENIAAAEAEYFAIYQRKDESLAGFKERLDNHLRLMSAVGAIQLSDERLASDFISKLNNSRYTELKCNVYNKIIPRPTTLAAAYQLASEYKTANLKQGVPMPVDAALFFTDGEKKKEKVGKYDSKEKHRTQTGGAHGSTKKQKSVKKICDWHGDCDHWTSECKKIKELVAKAKGKEDAGAAALLAEEDESAFMTVSTVELSLQVPQGHLGDFDVLLDNQSTVHIVRNPRLLSNIRETEGLPQISGVGGSLEPKKIGDSKYFGPVIYEPKVPANILSLALVSDRYEVTYDNNSASFSVHLPDRVLTFNRQGNLYVANVKTGHRTLVSTVGHNEGKYTTREVQDAKKAMEMKKRLGYPSDKDLIEMLSTGTVINSPITRYDVTRCRDIYGTDLATLKGKTTTSTPSRVKIEAVPRLIQYGQQLATDIMYIRAAPYLITVSSPLGYTMVEALKSRRSEDLYEALWKHISAYKAHYFSIQTIMTDGESGVVKLIPKLQMLGIQVDVAGPEQHVPTVEQKIRRVKERVRCHVTVSPYRVFSVLLLWLVYFCVSRINMVPSKTRVDRVSPYEAFTGRKIDYNRDLRIGWGEYVQVSNVNIHSKNSVDIQRTAAAISLMPTGNLQGSVKFFQLKTQKVITRDRWVKLPMPNIVIDYLNSLADNETKGKGDETKLEYVDEIIAADSIDEEEISSNIPMVKIDERPMVPPAHIIPDEAITDENEGEDREEHLRIRSPTEVIEHRIDEQRGESTELKVPDHPYGTRSKSGFKPRNPRLSFHISVKQAVRKLGDEAMNSIISELLQLHNKGVWTPISIGQLPKNKRIIRSMMFLKEKFNSEGSFEKLKARLCARGDMEELSKNWDCSSPTVYLESVLIIAGIAAKEKRYVMTVDITGAYLNAVIGNLQIYMRIDKFFASILLMIDEATYIPFLQSDGSMIVKLNKAMYGCVESAKLWNDCITKVLIKAGFKQNRLDPCVFNYTNIAGVQTTICIHVDDLMITSTDMTEIKRVSQVLKDEFKTITINEGVKHSYLGMTFNFEEEGSVRVTMEGYIDDMLRSYQVTGKAATPALDHLFEIRESPKLDEEKRGELHSRVAKLLYLAKRVRPEILPSVIFLTSRVKEATEDDWTKLDRILKYLNSEPNLGLRIKPDPNSVDVISYVDASFAVHHDYKSHTGGVITLGMGPVFVKSSKQKITTKSSTEAELVGLSDTTSQVIWTREFLIEQGYDPGPATIYQDNKSTIALANKGGSTSARSRHINIRFFFIKDRIAAGEIELKYKPTAEMIADILTKPLQGTLFRRLRNILLNWYDDMGADGNGDKSSDTPIIAGVC